MELLTNIKNKAGLVVNKRYIFLLDKMIGFGLERGSSIADCGCGDGGGSKYLKEMGFCVHSFDVNDESIKKCILVGVDALRSDISVRIPLDDDSVDAVICSEVLEHLNRQETPKAVKEIIRISRYNSIISVTVPENEKICFESKSHKQYLTDVDIKSLFPNSEILFNGIFCKKEGRCNRVLIFKNGEKKDQ